MPQVLQVSSHFYSQGSPGVAVPSGSAGVAVPSGSAGVAVPSGSPGVAVPSSGLSDVVSLWTFCHVTHTTSSHMT